MSVADLWQNPILLRTQRQSARIRRSPWIVLGSLVVLTLLVATIGGVAAEGNDPASVGMGIFSVFFGMASFLVMVMGAFVAGTSLSSEHQGRTWEMLLLTGMTPRQIIAGKFFSAFANVLFYLLALSPISAVAFVFGGVSAMEVLLSFGVLVALAALAVAYGLAVGSAVPQQGAVAAVLSMFVAWVLLAPFVAFSGLGVATALWPTLHLESPVWWPAIVMRSPVDVAYLLYAWVVPLALFACPTWLGIELAVAHVSEPGQDRFYAFKRALLGTTVVACLVCSAVVGCASSLERVAASLVFAFGVHLLLACAAFALVGDDVYPFRRARYELASGSAVRRLLGPSVLRGTVLFLSVWMGSAAIVSAVGVLRLVHHAAPKEAVTAILLCDLVAIPFVLFASGYLVFVRSGRQTPMVSRILTVVLVFALTGAPWVLYAIAGGISRGSRSELIVLGAPSPVYLGPMLGALQPRYGTDDGHADLVLGAGMVMAAVYVAGALLLFAGAARRAQRTFEAELAYERDVDRRLADEDAAARADAEGT